VPGPNRPVIVLHARNEFEAQMARDVLESATIPVLHLPSLSTGIFGVPQTTRIAVPEEYVDDALEALTEAGLSPRVEETPRGLAAFQDTVRDQFFLGRGPGSPRESVLSRVIVAVAVVVLAVVVYAFLRGR
jgi:hypothetical protein